MGQACCSSRDRFSKFGSVPNKHAHKIRLNVEIETNRSSSSNDSMLAFRSAFKGFHKVEDVKQLYRFEKVIGAGVFGKVYEATHLGANQACALKVIQKEKMQKDEVMATLLKQELAVLERVSHPYIVRVLDLFEDDHFIYVALELLPQGNLLQVLTKIRRCGASFTERDAASLVYQMLLAVSYVHEAGIIHRDLKMENVMVDLQPSHGESSMTDMVCKLTDFGFACLAGPRSAKENISCGTPVYMAPEMINGEDYDQKVDIWSLGVIVFAMLTSNFPFNARNKQLIYAQVLSKKHEPAYEMLNKYWDEGKLVKDFLERCLDKNPQTRWTAQQLLDHEWLKSMVDDQQQIADTDLVDTGMALLAYKSQSQFQSLMIQYLIGVKAQASELAQMKDIFLQLDTDRDGVLSEAEILAGMSRVMPDIERLIGDDTNWTTLVREIDQNSDGQVSYEEFITACYSRRGLLNDENLRIAFDLLDYNKDGKIQREDLAEAVATTSLQNLSSHNVDVKDEIWANLAGEADSNHDNEITFGEFKAYLTAAGNQQ